MVRDRSTNLTLERNEALRRMSALLRAAGRKLLAAACLLVMSIGYCAAASQADWDACRTLDLDTNIPACTRIIDDTASSKVDRINALILRAGAYLQQHSYVSAGRDYAAVVALDPKNIAALAGKAIAEYRRDEKGQAALDFSIARKLDQAKLDALVAGSEDLKEIQTYVGKSPPPREQVDAAYERLVPKVTSCPPGFKLDNNACTAVVCAQGERLDGNTCQPIQCGTGQRLSGGNCVAIVCPSGQQLSGSSCVAMTCPTGQRVSGGTCVAMTCPTGQRLAGNNCVAIVCGSGETLSGNDCVPESTSKYGALAMGETNHLGYGSVWNRGSAEEAKNDAMAQCRTQMPKGKCKIIMTSTDTCIGLSWTKTGTGWGASSRPTKEEAQSASLAQCRSANPNRNCVVAGGWCNN